MEKNKSAVHPDQSGFQRLIFVVTLLLIFIMAARTAVDSDMWWHLRAGEISWTTMKPVLDGVFSYTRTGQYWLNHSWLSEVIMFLLYKWGGSLALSGMVAVLAVLSAAFVYFQMEGSNFLKAFVMVLSSLVVALVWAPRPEMVSLAFMAVVGYLLYLFKWKERNFLWLLPLIFILWANLHGGYALGLILIGMMVAGEILNHILGFNDGETLSWKNIGWLVLWSVIAVLALIINPNGIRIWLAPFQTVGVNALQHYVQEWASPDFHDIGQQPFLWLLFLLIASIGLSGRRLDATDLLTVICFGYLAFVARRNFGPFALATAPVISRHLGKALSTWWARINIPGSTVSKIMLKIESANNGANFRFQKVINLGLVAFLAFIAFSKLYIVNLPVFTDQIMETTYPVQAVDWVEAHHPQGNMLSEYNWGGYLSWFARDYPVFVDGRTDLFGDVIINQWLQVIQANAGWQAVLDKWKVNLILIQPNRPIVGLLAQNGWKQLYKDHQSILFGR
ncbi:MAG: hypothetical protein P4L50_12960 [Anaerolineaceae bacterium]|nr:hypothetical protein [Anaerolineaceae bacterium]